MKQDAKKEEKSFPQNKYILVQMKRRTPKVQRRSVADMKNAENTEKSWISSAKSPDVGESSV